MSPVPVSGLGHVVSEPHRGQRSLRVPDQGRGVLSTGRTWWVVCSWPQVRLSRGCGAKMGPEGQAATSSPAVEIFIETLNICWLSQPWWLVVQPVVLEPASRLLPSAGDSRAKIFTTGPQYPAVLCYIDQALIIIFHFQLIQVDFESSLSHLCRSSKSMRSPGEG